MVLSAAQFTFMPCSHSWIALHPNPQGVIQFVGSHIFGAFPTVAYRHLLKSLFEAGYTVVAFPSRAGLNPWSIALDLLEEHYVLQGALIEAAIAQNYSPDIYLDTANYTWLGHGFGCQYVALLEVLSAPTPVLAQHFRDVSPAHQRSLHQVQQGLADIGGQLRQLEQRIYRLTGRRIHHGRPSILNEASLLLAPTIANETIAAQAMQRIFSKLIPAYLTPYQTHQLIDQSHLFHLTGLIQFARDRVAASTCQQLMYSQPHIRRRFLAGNHLEPVGIQVGPCVVDLNPLDKFVQPLKCRDLERKTLILLKRLRQTSSSSSTQLHQRTSKRKMIAA